MGVKDLWPMLESVKMSKLFSEMYGETVAVDLSMWIVDSNCVKQMAGAVTRPHLRNLFFRTSNLLQAGILPVFVIEGEAPELKWQTMADRQQVRQGKPAGGKPVKATARKANRSHFKTVIKECCEMLDYLGVPYIQSRGEAEATAAALNAHGLVDAVITEDGDAFLYGARTVYKNFTTTKTPGVDSYSMADIEEELHISRNHMIAVGLLIGCDYSPKGVPGVGKAQVLKVCAELSTDKILERLCTWAKSGLVGDESLSEKPVAQKIRKMGKTLFPEIIAEFMNKRQPLPSSINPWKKPLLSRAQDFNHSKMEWPINYSLEKMLPLLTLYCLSCVEKDRLSADKLSLRPEKIMKQRVRHGVPCLEILWQVDDPYHIDEEDDKSVELVTIENMDLIQKCYPDVVQAFIDAKSAKTKTKKPKKPIAEPQSQPTPTKQTAVAVNTYPTADPLCDISNMMGNLSVTAKLCANEETAVESFSEFDVANLSKSRVYSPEPLLNEYKHQYTYKTAESSYTELCTEDDLSLRLDILSHLSSHNEASQDSVIELSDDSLSPAPCGHTADHSKHEKEDDFTSSLQLSPSIKDLSSFMEDVASPSCVPKNELIGCSSETSTKRKPVRSKRKDSLDDLLADISDQLKTPARSTLTHKQHWTPLCAMDTNSPDPYLGNDSILTGYVTPTLNERTTAITFDLTSGNENSLLNVANDSITKLSVTKATQSCLANSTVSLFDVRTLHSFSDSDLSLFDVQPSIQESHVHKSLRNRQENTPHSHHAQSVTKSTPLDAGAKNMTYGNFDIVPQLSAFSFNE